MALYDLESPPNPQALAFRKGDVGEHMGTKQDWMKLKLVETGATGYVPVNYWQPYTMPAVPTGPAVRRVRALHDFEPPEPTKGYTNLRAGEVYTIINGDVSSKWWKVQDGKGGTAGFVPANRIEELF